MHLEISTHIHRILVGFRFSTEEVVLTNHTENVFSSSNMGNILILLLFSVLLIENIHSEKSKFLKEYEDTVNTLVTNGLKSMYYL